MMSRNAVSRSRWRNLLALAVLGWLGASCAATPEPPATPQATLPLVAVTPSLEPLVSGWLVRYAEAEGVPAFDLTVRTLGSAEQAAQAGEIVLVIAAAQPPPGWFATPLGREGLAVVVHPENPVRAFDSQELAGIFSGETRRWEALDGQALEIQPAIPIAEDEMRTLFTDRVMGLRRMASSARLAASPEIMANLVAEDPARIGLLPWTAVDDRVLVAAFEGSVPNDDSIHDGTYPLVLEVIASAPEEPQGAVREWLIWMQSQEIDA